MCLFIRRRLMIQKCVEDSKPEYNTPYVLFEGPAGFSFDNSKWSGDFEYATSPDGPWSSAIDTSTGKLYVRGSRAGVLQFTGGSFTKISGNVHALCNYNAVINNTIPNEQPSIGLNSMFRDNIYIEDASRFILPYNKLSSVGGYAQMFAGCENLKKAPELPAMILTRSGYSGMFENCKNLINAPELPATTLTDECYRDMFYGCTSLISAPKKLPAKTLTANCYNQMFYNCSMLENAPELPAETLVTNCYRGMFYGCGKINKIITHAMSINSSNTQSWLERVSSTGEFHCKPGSNWYNKSTSGVPYGWTRIEDL